MAAVGNGVVPSYLCVYLPRSRVPNDMGKIPSVFVRAHVQLSRVYMYLASTLDVMHMIECTRLSLSIVERAWE